MIKGKRVLGFIPARGGSKGVPNKNIRPLAGKALVLWTIEAANQSKYIDTLVLSSDSEQILQVASPHKTVRTLKRPDHLSSDESPTLDAVFHALENFPNYDYLVVLQPTSPLRTSEDIDTCIERCLENPSCISVVKSSESPFWTYFKDESHKLSRVIPSPPVTRRQDLQASYFPNGAVYVADVRELQKSNTLINEHTLAYEMPAERSVDIDTEDDFAYLEFLIQKKSRTRNDHASE